METPQAKLILALFVQISKALKAIEADDRRGAVVELEYCEVLLKDELAEHPDLLTPPKADKFSWKAGDVTVRPSTPEEIRQAERQAKTGKI